MPLKELKKKGYFPEATDKNLKTNEKIVAKAAGVVETKAVELTVIEITTTEGIVIYTTPGEACKADEVFDIESRSCKKK